MGDIAASRVLQVGNQSLPRLRSPLLDRIAYVVESRTKMFWVLGLYISESRILFTPKSLRRSGEASWRRVLTLLFSNFTKKIRITRVLLDRCDIIVTGILSWCLLPLTCCGSVPGSWAPRCCRHNFIVAILEYLSFCRHRKSLLCSCWWDNLDATQYWGGSSGVLP